MDKQQQLDLLDDLIEIKEAELAQLLLTKNKITKSKTTLKTEKPMKREPLMK